ncbi:Protein far1-related sequence 5 [Rhynchospora pubera]|uniref:Protein far1-related sequence 5 n=1 Tax=Rhynchospora pubera TaxID=906938 RepID=A0AAV8CQ51_9POAL|nr:Protein far1-related sequence 5 [Rhynchospora pubera]
MHGGDGRRHDGGVRDSVLLLSMHGAEFCCVDSDEGVNKAVQEDTISEEKETNALDRRSCSDLDLAQDLQLSTQREAGVEDPTGLDVGVDEYEQGDDQVVDIIEEGNQSVVEVGLDIAATEQPLQSVVPPPYIGMEFSSSDAGHMYYLRYAFDRGFGVMKNGGSSKNGRKRVIITCSKGGKPKISAKKAIPDKNRKVEKELCKARVYLKLDQSKDVWVVTGFCDKHNHVLCPDFSHKIRSHRSIQDWAINQLELNDRSSVPVISNINAVTAMGGGPHHCGFTERDARNVIAKMRRGSFQKGDAEALMQFFREAKRKDPKFYYSYKFDEDNRLDIVFWADSTSQSWYKFFGDVVTFDATYIVNKYV